MRWHVKDGGRAGSISVKKAEYAGFSEFLINFCLMSNDRAPACRTALENTAPVDNVCYPGYVCGNVFTIYDFIF